MHALDRGPTATESIHPRNHLRHFADEINVAPLLPADTSLFQRANQISFPSVFHPTIPDVSLSYLEFSSPVQSILPAVKYLSKIYTKWTHDYPPDPQSFLVLFFDNLLRNPSVRG